MNTTQMNAAVAHAANALPTVAKCGKSVTYRNVSERSHKRFGQVIAGRVEANQHALVEPGKRIVLWGLDRNKCSAPVIPYRREFKIGDTAEYDSYNLSFMGTIVAITEKTITVEDHGRKHRMSIYDFNWRNHDLDVAANLERNANWMD